MQIRNSSGDGWFMFLCGAVAGLMAFILTLEMTDKSPAGVYKRAYEDMKQGKIESVVKNKYPDLWIKYNIPEEKK